MIQINNDTIKDVEFDNSVQQMVKKQITTIPTIDEEGEITPLRIDYGIRFDVAGCGLKHILNMATLNSKTDIGNNLRARCKKDVGNGHNDTLDFFKNMLDEKGILIVSGFPTGLPDVPETLEQKKRTIVAQYNTMDAKERETLIAELSQLDKK